MVAVDTLAFVRWLEGAGVPRQQVEAPAEALAALVADELATKRDIQDLRTELRELDLRLSARLDQLESCMTIKLGGMLATAIALTAALVRLL